MRPQITNITGTESFYYVGAKLGPHEVGEIMAKTPTMMIGYLNR